VPSGIRRRSCWPFATALSRLTQLAGRASASQSAASATVETFCSDRRTLAPETQNSAPVSTRTVGYISPEVRAGCGHSARPAPRGEPPTRAGAATSPNVADSNSFSPVPFSNITCTKGSAASARRFRTCALISSICDVRLPESFLVCSLGLLTPVKHCRKEMFLHGQIFRAADSAARTCGHTCPKLQNQTAKTIVLVFVGWVH
jgi:hypothetical protein